MLLNEVGSEVSTTVETRVPLLPVKIFLSSPGDLFPERAVVKAFIAEELANYPHLKDNYAFLPYAFEDTVPPLVGEEPQLTVNKYLLAPQDADIVIVLLWARMGTPTNSLINPDTKAPYLSGTEYELLTAYRHRKADGSPLILVYHCVRPVAYPALQGPEQQAKVAALLARFRAGGDLTGLTQDFTDEADLRGKLRMGLLQVLEHDLRVVLAAQLAELRRERAQVYLFDGPLTNQYVSRPSALDQLRSTLLGSRVQVGVVAETALQGMGGLGKSVLARAVCEDPAVLGAFPDGVLWATLGHDARPLEQQRRWIEALGGDPKEATTIPRAKDVLQSLMRERTMLLVIDDVWREADANALRIGGPKCRVLFTTRDSATVPAAQLLRLGVMRRDESCTMLIQASGGEADDTLAERIAERLGDLPLGLALVGGQLRERVRWETIEASLARHDLQLGSQKEKTVLAAIASSVEALPDDDRVRYCELVIFPEGTVLDVDLVSRLWGRPRRALALQDLAPLSGEESDYLLGRLRARSLIQADDTLHDLQGEYLRSVMPDSAQHALNSAFVDQFGPPDRWPLLPVNEVYAWRRLAWHVHEAGLVAALRTLITDARYLERKISLLGTEAVASDIDLIGREEYNFAAALRLSAHVLDQDPTQLTSQMTGRLGDASPLHEIATAGPSLRLLSTSLIAPGGPLIRTLQGHMSQVNTCAFRPDGRALITASDDGTVRMWDVASGQEVRRLVEGAGPTSCALSPDGHLLATVSGSSIAAAAIRDKYRDPSVAHLWEVASGQEIRHLEGHTGRVYACAFSPDGRLLATASDDGTVRMWDVASGQEVRRIQGFMLSCAFSPDGRLLATVSRNVNTLESSASFANNYVQLWDVSSGSVIRSLEGNTRDGLSLPGYEWDVHGCAFSPDGRLLATVCADCVVRLWDVASGLEVHSFRGVGGEMHGCAFSPDGHLLATVSGSAMKRGYSDNSAQLWDVTSGQKIGHLAGHTSQVNGCAFSPDGRLLATVSGSAINLGTFDNSARLWDVTSTQGKGRVERQVRTVNSLVFSPEGRFVAIASGWTTYFVELWDLVSGEDVRCLEEHVGRVYACAFSPDGRLLATASDSGSSQCTARLWDVASGQEVWYLKGHDRIMYTCAFSPDGKLLATVSDDHTAQLWDVASGQEVRRLAGAVNARGCAFSPDGSLLATVAGSHGLARFPDFFFVRLWDVATGQEMRRLEGHTGTVFACAFSPDGKLLATVSDDHTARLWDVASGQEVRRLNGHKQDVHDCAFSPDGRSLATVSDDRTIRLWDTDYGTELAQCMIDSQVTLCAWNPKEPELIVADQAGVLHVIQVAGI